MHEVIVERTHVLLGQLAVILVGHRRIEMRAVGADTVIERSAELVERPVANARLLVRGDIGAPDGAHRAGYGKASGERFPARRGMAGRAVGGVHDVFALSLGRFPVGGKLFGRPSRLHRHEDEGEKCDDRQNDQGADRAKKSFHHCSPQISGRGLDRYCVRIACAVCRTSPPRRPVGLYCVFCMKLPAPVRNTLCLSHACE